MDLPGCIKIVKHGDSLKVVGLASLSRKEADQVVSFVRQHKSKILQDIERAVLPAQEFIELARRGTARLHTDGDGGLWWSTRAQDIKSVDYIQELWFAAFNELFQMLYRGELDEILSRNK